MRQKAVGPNGKTLEYFFPERLEIVHQLDGNDALLKHIEERLTRMIRCFQDLIDSRTFWERTWGISHEKQKEYDRVANLFGIEIDYCADLIEPTDAAPYLRATVRQNIKKRVDNFMAKHGFGDAKYDPYANL